jgi:hypothetical protein
MMMVLVIGGSMAIGMSCVGSLAGMYLYDPSFFDRLLGKVPEDPYGGDGTGLGGDDSPVTPTKYKPPIDKVGYIFNQGCKPNDDKPVYSLLSANSDHLTETTMNCKTNGNHTKWRFQRAGADNYYYIRNEQTKTYLTTGDKPWPTLSPKLSGENARKQKWYLGTPDGGGSGFTLTVSQKTPGLRTCTAGSTNGCESDKTFRYLGSSCSDASSLFSWTNGKGNQVWNFKLVGANSPSARAKC